MSTLDQLRADPRAFSLFAALRSLEALNKEHPRIGETPSTASEHIRLSQPPYLEFVASELRGAVEEGGRWHLDQYVFGLFGPNGALPVHLTELAAQRARHFNDPTLRDFINVLQGRLTALFYRAWAQSEPAVQADRPDEDRFARSLAALLGLDSPAVVEDDITRFYPMLARAGLLAGSTRSAEALETLLQDYFRLQITVQPYVPRWLAIPAEERLRLGIHAHCTLGAGATLGAYTRQANHSFELVLGPMSLDGLQHFLPGSSGLIELRTLVRFFTNDEWQWRLRILMRPGRVPGIELGRGAHLGWTSWLGTREGTADDVVIEGNPG
jgi:type VI secretion system protein ImpH